VYENQGGSPPTATVGSDGETDFQAIFAASSDGLVVNDLESGIVVEANPAFCRMHGYEREEIVGRHPGFFIHPDFHALFVQYLAAVRGGDELRATARDVRKDGTVFPVEVHGSSFRFRGRPHVLGVVRDITEQQEESQRLEARVAERTRELSTLLNASQAIAATLELRPLLRLLIDQLGNVVEYARAAILLHAGGELEVLSSQRDGSGDIETLVGRRAPVERFGMIWESVARAEPLIIDDVHGGSSAAAAYRAAVGNLMETVLADARSWMAVPMTLHDQVIGMFALAHAQPGFYTERHAGLATAFATQAAAAIENAQLFARVQEEARKTATLARISSSVALADPLTTILSGLAQSVVEATGADACAVVVVDGEPPVVRYAGSHGLPEGYGAAMAEAVRRGGPVFSFATLERQRPLVLRDVWSALLARPEFAPVHPFREQVSWDTMVSAPLVARNRNLGTLTSYYRRSRAPDEVEIAFQAAIASQAAVAVENARLFIEAQDKAVLEERTRLAHDLHDSATQTVFSLGMLAQAAQALHEQRSEKLDATLGRMATLAQQALGEMRALLFELRPDAQLEQGLDAALARLAATFQLRTGMTVGYSGGELPRLGAATEMAVFRIVQEALGNAVKHAQGSEVGVEARCQDGRLVVLVRDNGVGFDPAAPVTPSPDGSRGGQGLRSMQERAAAAGLALDVRSAPGEGTTVRLEAPLPPA
jgi:PAS domain S-box-containing protein